MCGRLCVCVYVLEHNQNSCLTAGHEGGHFTAEIAPIDVKAKKGKVAMTQDEPPRPQTTLEQFGKLQTVFKKGGTVTAANASVSIDL